MSVTVAELVEGVRKDAYLDASEPDVLRWLSSAQRKMCSRSGCYRKTLSLGVTVAGQADYVIPAGIVELLEVTVGGLPYGEARHADFAAGERGYLWVWGEGGIATRDDNAAGEAALRIFPVPAAGTAPEPGSEVKVYATLVPDALKAGEDASVKIPLGYEDALVSGAIATALLRTESRAGEASSHQQIFDNGCQELTRDTNRRFRGAGPVRVRLRV